MPVPPLVFGNRSKARTWIMDMRAKLAAECPAISKRTTQNDLHQ